MSKPAIICVDDEMFVLSSLKAELKSTFGEEYIIETAEGSLEALEILEELMSDQCDVPVVIADYIMPDMKGDELLKRIHEISPGTLKIMLTGQANLDAIGKAVNEAKLYRYIPKPWEPEDLILTIQEAIKSFYQEKQLEEQHQRLLEMNQTLEQKVTERTQELSNTLEELKATQLQLVHAEKMAAVGNLVAGIAHEVNNPIGVVKSSADISDRCLKIIEKLVGDSDCPDLKDGEQYNKTLNILKSNNQIIVQASDRISRLVKSLKSFTRLDEADMQAVDVHDCLDNTLALIRQELDEKISIVKNYSELPKVPCYVNQMNQVFMSLILFAVQNMENKGTLTITTKFVKLDKKEKAEFAEVSISDTGKPLSEEQLNTMFDLGFWTKDSRIQLRTELSIAYNVIQKHEGKIQVTSAPDAGTTITILLPLYHQIT